jgi:condensin complex subunit 2
MLNTTTLDTDVQDSESEAGDMGGDMDLPMDMGGDSVGIEQPVEDFFVGDQAVQDDYGGDDFGGPDQGMDGAQGDAFGAAQGNEPGAMPNGAFEPFDPRRMPNERDLVMAMTDADGEGGMMDYFDQNFLKNWAGPEHWKLHKKVRKGRQNGGQFSNRGY